MNLQFLSFFFFLSLCWKNSTVTELVVGHGESLCLTSVTVSVSFVSPSRKTSVSHVTRLQKFYFCLFVRYNDLVSWTLKFMYLSKGGLNIDTTVLGNSRMRHIYRRSKASTNSCSANCYKRPFLCLLKIHKLNFRKESFWFALFRWFLYNFSKKINPWKISIN